MYSFVVTITDDAGMYQEYWSAASIDDATDLVVQSFKIQRQDYQSITVEFVS